MMKLHGLAPRAGGGFGRTSDSEVARAAALARVCARRLAREGDGALDTLALHLGWTSGAGSVLLLQDLATRRHARLLARLLLRLRYAGTGGTHHGVSLLLSEALSGGLPRWLRGRKLTGNPPGLLSEYGQTPWPWS